MDAPSGRPPIAAFIRSSASMTRPSTPFVRWTTLTLSSDTRGSAATTGAASGRQRPTMTGRITRPDGSLLLEEQSFVDSLREQVTFGAFPLIIPAIRRTSRALFNPQIELEIYRPGACTYLLYVVLVQYYLYVLRVFGRRIHPSNPGVWSKVTVF